jgi:hypothetical protein
MHALERFGRAGINGIDFCVGVRTADKGRMQDTVHFEIIDKLRCPEQQRGIFNTFDALADLARSHF